jgi:SHAQKYF class myb-like DNA-binding protein
MPQQAPSNSTIPALRLNIETSPQRDPKAGMKPSLKTGTLLHATQPRYWSEQEHARFLEALELYGFRDVRSIAEHVATRTATQVRTHAQKYYLRLAREAAKLVLNFVNGDVQLNNDQIWEYFILSQQVDSQTGMRIPLAAVDAARDQFRAQNLLDVLQRSVGDSGSSLDGRPSVAAEHVTGQRDLEKASTRENEAGSRKKGRRRRSLDESMNPSGTELYLVEEQGGSSEEGPNSTSAPFLAPDEMDGPDELAALLETESYNMLDLANSEAFTPRRNTGRNRRTRSNSRGRSGLRLKQVSGSGAWRRSRSIESRSSDLPASELKQPSPKEANRTLENILKEETLQTEATTASWDPVGVHGQGTFSMPGSVELSFSDSSTKLAPAEQELNESNALENHRGHRGALGDQNSAAPGSEMFPSTDFDIDLLQRGLEAFAQDPQCESRAKLYAEAMHLPLHLGGVRAPSRSGSISGDAASFMNREPSPAWYRRAAPSSPLYLHSLIHDRPLINFSPTPESASPLLAASPHIMMSVDDLELSANMTDMHEAAAASNAPNALSQPTISSAFPDRGNALSPLVRTMTPRTLAMQRTASTQSIMQLLSRKPTEELASTAWMFLNSIGDGQEDRFLQMLQQIDSVTTRPVTSEMTTNSNTNFAGVSAANNGRDASSQMMEPASMASAEAPRALNRGNVGQMSLLSARPSRLTHCNSWGSLARLPSHTSFVNLGEQNPTTENLDRT